MMTLASGGTPSNQPCGPDDGLGLLPTRDWTKAPCFWDQQGFQIVSSAEMVSSGGSVAATTDVMSDFLAGWRIQFSTAVASEPESEEEDNATTQDVATEDEAEEEAATNLFQANGGNLALSAAYPLYASRFRGGTGGFVAVTYGRIGGTFDAFGDTGGNSSRSFEWRELNANAEWALTTQTRLVSMQEIFNIEVVTKAALVAGTKQFRTSVGIDDGESGPFVHGQIGANLRIGGSMVIGARYNYFSADGLDGGATLTVGFNRKPGS